MDLVKGINCSAFLSSFKKEEEEKEKIRGGGGRKQKRKPDTTFLWHKHTSLFQSKAQSALHWLLATGQLTVASNPTAASGNALQQLYHTLWFSDGGSDTGGTTMVSQSLNQTDCLTPKAGF